jgi:hypothetical protein
LAVVSLTHFFHYIPYGEHFRVREYYNNHQSGKQGDRLTRNKLLRSTTFRYLIVAYHALWLAWYHHADYQFGQA